MIGFSNMVKGVNDLALLGVQPKLYLDKDGTVDELPPDQTKNKAGE